MPLDLSPLVWNWTAITRGDTYPATRIQEEDATTDLVRVRLKVRATGGTLLLSLDSAASEITIDDDTAGSWDFTIPAISAEVTATIRHGVHNYNIEITDSAGTVRTEFSGTWEILPQITN